MKDVTAIAYNYVTSSAVMAKAAEEMIEYAKAHPFCHKAMMEQAEADPSLKTERVGPMMRVRGTKDVMEQYNRFLAFRNTVDGSIQAIQAAYTIASDDDIRGVRQLTLVENLKQTLDESVVAFILMHFFKPEEKLMVMKETPPHVRVVYQVPDHVSANRDE
jgi:hypothetical protein